MPGVKLSSIDEYESFLALTLKAWTPEQRLAFAAGMAERWLPAYIAFSEAEEWGDAEGLRRSLDAVWGHLAGRSLSAADRARHLQLLEDSTPHMDDFDALDALVAASLVNEAHQRKKKGRGQTAPALGAALGRAIAWAASGDLDSPWA